jgi:Ca-activated chloride channel homolog
MRCTGPRVLAFAAALCVAAVASCKGKMSASLNADVSIEPPAGSGTSSGSYAAMEEIPVGGGELRLVAAMPAPAGIEDDRPGAGEATEMIAFPLRHTAVHARVAGMMGQYTVEQVFENPFDEPIEAVYVFPLGDEAAVSAYSITIGERTIAGEIQTREKARRTYDEAKTAGHTAALVEQEKANVFSQRIANIAPRETIRVKLEYVELLDYADGRYEVVVPLVVGPRYLPGDRPGRRPVGSRHAGTPGQPGTTSIPYVDEVRAGSTVSFTAEIEGAVPISGVESPSHDLEVQTLSPAHTRVTLERADVIPNRDLVVRFRTAGDRTMVGVLAHRQGNEGYFALAVQPKGTYRTGDITSREMIILVDISGSMDGEPLAQARDLARALVATLSDRDTFNVIAFASGTEKMAERAIAGDAAGKARGAQFVADLESGGGTDLDRGLIESLATEPGADRIRMVYVLSDGYVGNDDVILDAARAKLGHNRIFPVGIGSAPNRALLNQLADVGRGYASYLNLGEAATEVGTELVRRSAHPYLTDIAIDWQGLEVEQLTPAKVPDVYAGMPLIVSGRYRKPGSATVKVSATTAGRRVTIPLQISLPAASDLPPVASLWARRRIEALMSTAGEGGVGGDAEREVTEIGLAFHLVTEFTSFVAVDRTRVVQPGGATRLVEQPAANPAGVNLATAVASPSPMSSPGGSYASSGGSSGDSWGGGGGGGGDADLMTIFLALALIPLALGLRRLRRT